MRKATRTAQVVALAAAGLAAACSKGSPGPSNTQPDSAPVCTSSLPSTNDLDNTIGAAGVGDSGCANPTGCGVMNNESVVDFTGAAATYSPAFPMAGQIPTTTADFSQSYGQNGRTCFSCHAFDNGWALSINGVQQEFQANAQAGSNDALDPVFRPIDGANSPTADVSTATARMAAYSMLINRAVIRVGMPVPANAEFTLTTVDDPYGFASASQLSLFRRPLPTQNLRFESDIMWDGRETVACGPISEALANQANDAILSHAQAAAPLTPEVRTAIVDFEKTLYAAQTVDFNAGALDSDGALGGPVNLSALPFYLGMNDSRGADPMGTPFDPVIFDLFDAWGSGSGSDAQSEARAAIVRGQAIFNTRTFTVTGVSGLNDELGMPSVQATCGTCHDTPEVGTSSLGHRYDIGISDAANRTPDLPLYTFTNVSTGETIQTTDPGRALVTGRWSDMNRFKVPALRNLGARFPYFHNGSAATILDAVKYTNTRFAIGLSDAEMNDLVAFLEAL